MAFQGGLMMEPRVCPVWVGYLLLNPLRKFVENPDRLFSKYVREGMTVLEPGCGPGFFTLPLARMAGPTGRVVAVDLQEKMLDILRNRAQKAGLEDRIDFRRVGPEGMGLADLADSVDFTVAMHMVHEVRDKDTFFQDVYSASKPGGRFMIVEPRGHASSKEFDQMLAITSRTGFKVDNSSGTFMSRGVILSK
jgi:ubiquinone/menaquinone biosynthesis C-methylase UbiE